MFQTVVLVWALFAAAWAAWEGLRANRLGERTHAAEQRPWLAVNGLEITSNVVFTATKATFICRIEMTNSGITPALNVDVVRYATGKLDFDRAAHEAAAIRDFERSPSAANLCVFPGQTQYLSFEMEIPKSNVDLWDDGIISMVVVIVGAVQYSAYNDGSVRRTGFSYLVTEDALTGVVPVKGDITAVLIPRKSPRPIEIGWYAD